MNWFEQNKFLGWFLIGLTLGCLGVGYFFFRAKASFDAESARFKTTAAELRRLESLTPFPDESHYQKASALADAYKSSLAALQEEIKSRELPLAPLAPNEFQTKLRLAVVATREKARANKVKLPDNFFLGFDEFATSLPSAEAAPLLGRELKAVQMLINILIEAHVDSIGALHREPIAQERRAASSVPKSPQPAGRARGALAASSPTPAASPTMVESNPVSVTFASSPSAARKALNQIVSAKEQFFIIRTLHVRNEKEKGPPRTEPVEAPSLFNNPSANKSAANTASPGATPEARTVTFVVGNEHIETSAQIEIVNFKLAQPETR
ncbi:MAG: Amuc_1100 family pilus-like protein [Verrucomicrobiota bacterium]